VSGQSLAEKTGGFGGGIETPSHQSEGKTDVQRGELTECSFEFICFYKEE
jgi:hypothetical protein